MLSSPKTAAIVTQFVAWYHVASHFAICIADYTQVVQLLDFVTRHDGTASDPQNLLPLELIYAGITAMSFGTVGFAFVLALLGNKGVNMKGAASLSVFFHGIWFVHMVWRWEAWRAMMHPSGAMQPGFFLFGHLVWTVLSALVLTLPDTTTTEQQSKAKNK